MSSLASCRNWRQKTAHVIFTSTCVLRAVLNVRSEKSAWFKAVEVSASLIVYIFIFRQIFNGWPHTRELKIDTER
ncbi:MAG: hypothetical protein KTR32_37790, partial [Granulosicoccus sp.]|nr:hypothetical protein [Granulosicoccus sp.]